MNRSPAYYLGVAVGIAVALAAIWIIKRVIFGKRTREKREYDERQQQAMGRACKYGYYTLLIYLGVIALFDLMTGIRWASLYTGVFLGVLLSVGVFGIVGIRMTRTTPSGRARSATSRCLAYWAGSTSPSA